MSKLLSGTVAVVTGGSSGNGRRISITFAEHGANVVVADVSKTPRDADRPTHEVIGEETSSEASFVQCDVSDVRDLERAIEAAEEFGGVNTMVNNAAINRREDFLRTTEEQYDRMMAVNAKGVFFGCQVAAKRMAKNDGGCIINISSTSGIVGSPTSATYSASKGAVRLLTYALAGKLGPKNIRVNAIHPGTVETKMNTEDLGRFDPEDETDRDDFTDHIPLRRVGQPRDVANAAVFLASDLADYVNGESLLVDGGRTHTAYSRSP